MILHVDMDAFYASVEALDSLELRGQPVIVGGTPEGRGVVAAASYEARKFGVHSAMPTAQALKLCPQAIVIRPRMARYAEVSDKIQEILMRYTPLVEPLSLDEAFLDVGGSTALFGSAVEIARRIKSDIRSEIGLVASVGVAPNKFLAKIASDLEKPDSLVVVTDEGIQDFLAPLPIGRLWGVGKVTGTDFARLGVHTIRDLRRLTKDKLCLQFGREGELFWELAHGRDVRKVVPDRDARTISHERTFSIDIVDMEMLRGRLLELTEMVGQRLRRHGLSGRTVQLKLRYSDFTTITRSLTLRRPTNTTDEIWKGAVSLLSGKLPKRRLQVRLIGIGVQQLSRNAQPQPTLFDMAADDKQSGIDQVTDRIRLKFGAGLLRRGINLDRGLDRREGH